MSSVEEQAEQFRADFAAVQAQISRIIVGNADVVENVLICLVGGGHVLLEGVPGLGKTLLVRTLSEALNLKFARIQFTPDLMPADITGTNILWEGPDGARQFRFQPGPVFANIVLADEINRATPKTQSAMLEAMQEHAVTSAGTLHRLAEPFFVLATQNPIEMEGTYPLPEAQTDRFLFKLLVPDPTFESLRAIIDRTTGSEKGEVSPVLDAASIMDMRAFARQVALAPPVRDFAIRLVMGTRPDSEYAPESIKRYSRFGASPRGAQSIVTAGKVRALLAGRYNVAIDDLCAAALPALRHRVLLNFEGEAQQISSDTLVSDVIKKTRSDLEVKLGA